MLEGSFIVLFVCFDSFLDKGNISFGKVYDKQQQWESIFGKKATNDNNSEAAFWQRILRSGAGN